MRYNSEWLDKLGYAGMIGLAAKVTLSQMLDRKEFLTRFRAEQDISLHELLYPLAQGYDSVALECDVELGGTDQKFNLLMGRELQRDYGQKPQIVLMTPILEGLDGVQKMSKSLGNAIGINEPASEMYGKLMSISDELMWKYWVLLTDLKRIGDRRDAGGSGGGKAASDGDQEKTGANDYGRVPRRGGGRERGRKLGKDVSAEGRAGKYRRGSGRICVCGKWRERGGRLAGSCCRSCWSADWGLACVERRCQAESRRLPPRRP